MPESEELFDRLRHTIVSGGAGEAPVSHLDGIIHQALGMTMEYVGCSALPALELLDAQATATHRTLYFVAVEVIERRYLPEPLDRA